MIRFSCTCGTQLELPLVLAGESGRCPKCRRTLTAPIPAGHVPWHEVQRGEEAQDGVRIIQVARNPMATRTRALIAFPCPACAEPLRAKVSHAGAAGKCGVCAATFTIPERPAPSLSSPRGGWGGAARGRPARPKRPAPPSPSPPPPPAEPPVPAPSRHGPPRVKSKASAASASAGPSQPTRASRRPAPPPSGREAFKVISVACTCGRKVKAPLVRIRAGEARCPTCDEVLLEP